jgi:hypothetical protein
MQAIQIGANHDNATGPEAIASISTVRSIGVGK